MIQEVKVNLEYGLNSLNKIKEAHHSTYKMQTAFQCFTLNFTGKYLEAKVSSNKNLFEIQRIAIWEAPIQAETQILF